MGLPTTAAPRRPAPTPKGRPPPPACAWVVVEARPPVTASVASARAAILVLIDIKNSIRLGVAVLACMPSWTERLRFRFECAPEIRKARLFANHYMRLGEKASNLGAVRKRLGVEF